MEYNKVLQYSNNLVQVEVTAMFPQMRVYISGLRGIDKLNVCDNCKVDVGCTECFPGALYQSGTCSLCGYKGNIVNVAIARKSHGAWH